MINEVTPTDALSTWWENTQFSAKEHFNLNEKGQLILSKSEVYPERVVATLTPEQADMVVKALLEKFPEVEAKANELRTEWEATDDKLKLMGKVSRLREYLLHTNAIGDFTALFRQLTVYEQEISALVDANYKQKQDLVDKAEAMSRDSNSWKEVTQEFKDISEKWKNIGFVDKDRNDALWNRLEDAKNKFFERKRHHQEEQEKEMLANLDLKMELVDKAERITNSEHWKETTEQFKQLMEQWKATGRTVADKNEELWVRFIKAKNNFFEQKKKHFETIQVEQEANYEVKLALVARAEALKDSTDWNKTTQAYGDIMIEWKKAGRVPLEKADELWNSLNAAREHFFQNKRQHTESMKVTLEDNYAQKLALLKHAEEIKHSTHWREATEEMNELLNEWKTIGPVPREHTNTLWDKFIGARKYFFERKDADRERRKQHAEKQYENKFSKTRTFLSQLEGELKEEQERLDDFRIALENVTPGNKEEELRAHLSKLIAQSEQKIKHKEEMVKDIARQLEDIQTQKTTADQKKAASADTARGQKAAAAPEASQESQAPEAPEAEERPDIAEMPKAPEVTGTENAPEMPAANASGPSEEAQTEETPQAPEVTETSSPSAEAKETDENPS